MLVPPVYVLLPVRVNSPEPAIVSVPTGPVQMPPKSGSV